MDDKFQLVKKEKKAVIDNTAPNQLTSNMPFLRGALDVVRRLHDRNVQILPSNQSRKHEQKQIRRQKPIKFKELKKKKTTRSKGGMHEP